MRIELSTILDCPAVRAWQEVQATRLLEYVANPLMRFEPLQPAALPECWRPGDRYLVSMMLFGRVPFGRQWVVISQRAADPGCFQVRDNGHGDLISRWDHWITIQAAPGDKTRYTDRVDIQAGLLTPLVWLFAQVFYRHRQRRWRALAKGKFVY